MVCGPSQVKLMDEDVASLIVSALHRHMQDADVADACCRAIQNLTYAFGGAASMIVAHGFAEEACKTLIACVNVHNGNRAVLEQALGSILNLSADEANRVTFEDLGVKAILRSIAASATYGAGTRQLATRILDACSQESSSGTK